MGGWVGGWVDGCVATTGMGGRDGEQTGEGSSRAPTLTDVDPQQLHIFAHQHVLLGWEGGKRVR